MQERPTLDTCHFKLNWNPFNKIYGHVWQMTGWWDFHHQLSNFKIWISSSIFHPQTAFDARARYTISPCLFVPSSKRYLALSGIPLMLKAIECEDELLIIQSLLHISSFLFGYCDQTQTLQLFVSASCHVRVKINSSLIFNRCLQTWVIFYSKPFLCVIKCG